MSKSTITRQATVVEDNVLKQSAVVFISGSTITKLKGNDIKGVSKAGSTYAITTSHCATEPYLRSFNHTFTVTTGSVVGVGLIPTGLRSSHSGSVLTFQCVSGSTPLIATTPVTALTASINWEYKIS